MLTAVIPPLCALLGYYPGDRVGFGGREARGLMADWLQAVQQDDCPVLAIYCNREIQWQEITSEALGIKADHVSWAKRPAIAVSAISAWIGQRDNNKEK